MNCWIAQWFRSLVAEVGTVVPRLPIAPFNDEIAYRRGFGHRQSDQLAMAPMGINCFAIMTNRRLHVREEMGGSTWRRAEQRGAKGEPLIPTKGSFGSPPSTGRPHHHHRLFSPPPASPFHLLGRSPSSPFSRGAPLWQLGPSGHPQVHLLPL